MLTAYRVQRYFAVSEAELLRWLRRVKDEPDRDDVRLVFADWLDEQGDQRGEWVRVQCRRSNLPPDHPDQTSLAAREEKLARGPLRGWLEPGLPHLSDRRFFPASAGTWETELYPPLPLEAARSRGLFHLNCPGSALLHAPCPVSPPGQNSSGSRRFAFRWRPTRRGLFSVKWLRSPGRHDSPYAAWPEISMRGALRPSPDRRRSQTSPVSISSSAVWET